MSMKPLLIAAGICGLALTSHAQLDPSLVAWYKFDEGAGATIAANSVIGSTVGAIGANVVTGVAGISGNAYQFPNSSAQAGIVDMGNANFFSSIASSGAITLSAWIKTTDTNNGRNVVVFAGSSTVANSYIDLGVVGTGQPAPAGVANGRLRPAGDPGITEIFSTPTVVANDQWHQLTLTIGLTADNITLYVDGVSVATNALALEVFPVFNNFEIGRLGRTGGSGVTDPFGGLIDDVQVYDRAITASEVLWLYNNPGEALTVVPEPAEVSVAIAAGLGLLIVARRRRAAKSIA